MATIQVIKSNGNKEDFNSNKYIQALIRSQAKPETAEKILRLIQPQLHDNIPSSEIYQLTKQLLHDFKEIRAFHLYQLREAIANLDSIAFEKYTSQIFKSWGYKTRWNVIVAGKCIEHQVDVIIEKDNQTFLVECKHHRKYHRDSGLGKIMELYARIKDIDQLDGPINYSTEVPAEKIKFDQAWLVTNTKFSLHAIRYAKCKSIRLTGWQFGYNFSLEHLSQRSHTYPLTLFGLTTAQSAALVPFNLVTSSDLENNNISTQVYEIVSTDKINEIKDLISLLKS